MDDSVLHRVQEAMASVFGVEPEQVRGDSRREDFSGWDSMGHLNLVMELEARFGRSLSLDEVMGLSSVADIVEVMSND